MGCSVRENKMSVELSSTLVLPVECLPTVNFSPSKTMKLSCPHQEVFIWDMAGLVNFLTLNNYEETFLAVKRFYLNLLQSEKRTDDFGFWLNDPNSEIPITKQTSTTQNHNFLPQRAITLRALGPEASKSKKIAYIQSCQDLLNILSENNFEDVFSDIYTEFKIFTLKKSLSGQSIPSEWTFECVY